MKQHLQRDHHHDEHGLCEEGNEQQDQKEDEEGNVNVLEHICYLLATKLMMDTKNMYSHSEQWFPGDVLTKHIKKSTF